jgi:hypothetical protein
MSSGRDAFTTEVIGIGVGVDKQFLSLSNHAAGHDHRLPSRI